MGRRAQPTALKILRGNPGKRPLNAREPQPEALATAAPAFSEPEAGIEWQRTIVPAIKIGQVTQADRVLAIAHCELWAAWRKQHARATKEKAIVPVGKHRYPMPNAWRTLAAKTLHQLIAIDDKLGFSPTSRAKVQVQTGHTMAASATDQQRKKFFGGGRG